MTEHVPTVLELLHMGLAYPMPRRKGETQTYHVTQEGHDLMGAAMRRNAQEFLDNERQGT